MKERLEKRNAIFKNRDHIDINIEIEKLPFEAKLGEELFCAVKCNKRLGMETTGIVELFIKKKSNKKTAKLDRILNKLNLLKQEIKEALQ